MKVAVENKSETRFIEFVREVEINFGNEYKLVVTETDEEVSINLTYDDGETLQLECIKRLDNL